MPLTLKKFISAGLVATAAYLLAGCHVSQTSAPPPATLAQTQQEQAKDSTHITPDRQAAINAQRNIDSQIKPESNAPAKQ